MFTVVQVETTGLEPATARLACLVMARFDVEAGNQCPNPLTVVQRINPGMRMPAEAALCNALSGLDDAPLFSSLADRVMRALVRQWCLVVFNAPFVVGVLSAELMRAGQDTEQALVVADGLVLARRLWAGEKNTLAAICQRTGVEVPQRWDTEAKALAVGRTFWEMCRALDLTPEGAAEMTRRYYLDNIRQPGAFSGGTGRL